MRVRISLKVHNSNLLVNVLELKVCHLPLSPKEGRFIGKTLMILVSFSPESEHQSLRQNLQG